MSDPAAIAKTYLEAFNKRDWGKFRQCFAQEYTYTGGDGQEQQGPDAGVAIAQLWANVMSDAKVEIRKIHVAGNVAIVEFIGKGTHDGAFMGIPATTRKVSVPVVTVLETKDGKIAREREYMDMAHVMQQLGVTEAPAVAVA